MSAVTCCSYSLWSLLIISHFFRDDSYILVCPSILVMSRLSEPSAPRLLTSMKLGVYILPVCGHNLQEADFWSPAPCAAWCHPKLKPVGRDDLLWVGCLYRPTLSLQHLRRLQWLTICYVWLFYRFLLLHTMLPHCQRGCSYSGMSICSETQWTDLSLSFRIGVTAWVIN